MKINLNGNEFKFNGKTLRLCGDAEPTNYGTQGQVRYTDYAVEDATGTKYIVTWDTTSKWDDVINCKDCEHTDHGSYVDHDTCIFHSDVSNACDWENPISIEEV